MNIVCTNREKIVYSVGVNRQREGNLKIQRRKIEVDSIDHLNAS